MLKTYTCEQLAAPRITFELGDVQLITADDLQPQPSVNLRQRIENPEGLDRSSDTLAVAGAMVREGYDDQEIAGILLNPAKPISAHCLDQADPRRQVERCIVVARGDETPKGACLDDLWAYLAEHKYVFSPLGQLWPAASVNSLFPAIPMKKANGEAVLNEKGKQVFQSPSRWLDQNRAVQQLTWAPGFPQIISDRLVSDGGWIDRPGSKVFNLYRPPMVALGDALQAGPWIDHMHLVYPDDAPHLIKWLAHRVQRPSEKVNHAIVLGGSQGVGKDTMLEPVKAAIGPWNFQEVSPQQAMGRFNGFLKSVILRTNEARDLGELDRFAFYDHMKTYTAAPPDVLRVDEKNLREHAVFNVCGVIITTNHKLDGIYLPADDRRHYVAWTEMLMDDFDEPYWTRLWDWYDGGGIGHVAAYLSGLALEDFNPKAPPPKTDAFWEIVGANQAPEDAEFSTALKILGYPDVITIDDVYFVSDSRFRDWLGDRRNSRQIPHRLDDCGYTKIRNRNAKDGYFKVGLKRCAVYAKKGLPAGAAQAAAEALVRRRSR
jgi:hypothetical protein